MSSQRGEIARLKGMKGPPSNKPSGLEQATSGKSNSGGGRRGRAKRLQPKITFWLRRCLAEASDDVRFKQ